MPRTENEIRDHLLERLDLVEPGLTLIGREKLLRNISGARGFLDIFARTSDGKFLIIEVKRSDATAREAIQELYKYVALIKQNLLVKYTEVRLIIASTDWHELNAPFTEFVHTSPYDCTGINLHLGADGLTQTASEVVVAPLERPRRISRRHFIWGFKDEEAAKRGVTMISAHMKACGLQDFVIFLLAVRVNGDTENRYLYFAQQELSLDEYMMKIKMQAPSGELSEFKEHIDELVDEEDKVSEAADKVWEFGYGTLHRQLSSIESIISYPERARIWFSSKKLVSSELFRYGRFKDDFLTDVQIQAELIGSDGASFHHFEMEAKLLSKTEMQAIRDGANNILHANAVWRSAINDFCDYATFHRAISVKLRIFCNEDILRSLAYMTIGQPQYTDIFEFQIEWPDKVEKYLGIILWDGTLPEFKPIIDDYFEGDQFQYFTYAHFGEQRGLNADLLENLGLSYHVATVRDESLKTVNTSKTQIKETRKQSSKLILEFPVENPIFCGRLIKIFLEHEQEFAMNFDTGALTFAEGRFTSMLPSKRSVDGTYWAGSEASKCDICSRDLTSARFMIDGPAVANGPWACMCAICFDGGQEQIGLGKGQLYEREGARWRLIAGA